MKKIISVILAFIFTASTALAYSDVNESTNYSEAIDYITDLEIVEGYEDGTYRPDILINRAEFTKILVKSKINRNPVEYADACFSDFNIVEWYASYVCYAKEEGIISGYPDGSFGPANNINLAEASKILVNVFEIEHVEPQGSEWYSVYIESLGSHGYIPSSFEYINDKVTRGQMAEMIWRIMEEKHDLDSADASSLENSPCQDLGEDLPANVDMDIVRQTWIDWYNAERNSLGLHSYIYNDQLDRSATVWSEVSKDRGYIDHKRPGQANYYDYQVLLDWFADLGIVFENGAFTENIAWEMYYCPDSQADCTQEMINSVEKGFNFFMSEKGGSYTAHYDSIISPVYKEIGLGVAVDRSTNKFYLTVHYTKEIISDPMRICD